MILSLGKTDETYELPYIKRKTINELLSFTDKENVVSEKQGDGAIVLSKAENFAYGSKGKVYFFYCANICPQ